MIGLAMAREAGSHRIVPGGKLVAVVLLLALVATGLAWLMRRGEVSRLPRADEAVWTEHFPGGERERRWRTGEARELAALFEGARRDRNPMKWPSLGRLELLDEGCQVAVIDVFGPLEKDGKAAFRIGDRYFLGYDSTRFRELVRKGRD